MRSCSTAARNLQRRGWYAETCLPGRRARMMFPGTTRPHREGGWKVPVGQSMGFVPAVSAGAGGRVAIGAGAEVLLRTGGGGWVGFRPEGAREGRDDVVSVQLLASDGEVEKVLVGTAAGRLDVLSLRTGGDWMEEYEVVDRSFTTEGLGVRDTALRPDEAIYGGATGERSLVSAVLGQGTLALYDLASDCTPSSSAEPLSNMRVTSSTERRNQAWRTKWLNPTTVAVTLSSAREPIKLYDIRPTGLSDRPISRISIHSSESRTVYPIEPLHNTGGRIFASGGYDGVVRVHDTRCADRSGGVQHAAREEAEYGAIYSLLSRPGHHLLAGTAQFDVLSVLDLRAQAFLKVPLAHSEDAGAVVINPDPSAEPLTVKGFDASTVGCYDYKAAKGGRSGSYYLYRRDRGGRFEGPVYNLSSPSPYSPLIYVGLENSVVQLCLHGMADAHPDPAITSLLDMMAADRPGEEPRGKQRRGKKTKAPETGPDIRLKAVEHGSVVVMAQKSVAEAKARKTRPDELDERW